MYLVATSVGLLVGLVYALLGVRSPAPPLVALCGLLGILVGEQVVPIGRRLAQGQPVTARWLADECLPQLTGVSPFPRPPDLNANDASP
jgi:XapX domain-containing protein